MELTSEEKDALNGKHGETLQIAGNPVKTLILLIFLKVLVRKPCENTDIPDISCIYE